MSAGTNRGCQLHLLLGAKSLNNGLKAPRLKTPEEDYNEVESYYQIGDRFQIHMAEADDCYVSFLLYHDLFDVPDLSGVYRTLRLC